MAENTDNNDIVSWRLAAGTPSTGDGTQPLDVDRWYYQWNAAVAGTGGVPGASTNYVEAKQNAQGSICPRGWRLPTGGDDGEYEELVKIYEMSVGGDLAKADEKLLQQPLNFVRSGAVDLGAFVNNGFGGRYWSSTASSSSSAYRFSFNPSALLSWFSFHRQAGFPVRCLAR